MTSAPTSSLPYNANHMPLFHGVNKSLSPHDEMFANAKATFPSPEGAAFHYYFFSGAFIAGKLHEYFKAKKTDSSKLSLLEYAAGYGRITRYLAPMFRTVTASDLEPSMIEFQKAHFGVDGFVSAVQSSEVRWPPRTFDVVFCFSLFTHLHPSIWNEWFWALFERVSDRGYFIISTLPPSFARARGEVVDDRSLLTYARKNETSGRLDLGTYGQTVTDIRHLLKLIDGRDDIQYSDHFSAGLFDLYQDIHIFRRGGGSIWP